MTKTLDRPIVAQTSPTVTGFTGGDLPPPKPRKVPAVKWGKIVIDPAARVHVVMLESLQLRRPPDANVIEDVRPDQLKTARLVRTTRIKLTFADNFKVEFGNERLGMPVDRIRWDTVRVAPDGDALIVTAIGGKQITLAATALRYQFDGTYAAQVDAKLASLRQMLGDLDEGETPAGMFDQPATGPAM